MLCSLLFYNILPGSDAVAGVGVVGVVAVVGGAGVVSNIAKYIF